MADKQDFEPTARDLFALVALHALIVSQAKHVPGTNAMTLDTPPLAYEIADRMLAQRTK